MGRRQHFHVRAPSRPRHQHRRADQRGERPERKERPEWGREEKRGGRQGAQAAEITAGALSLRCVQLYMYLEVRVECKINLALEHCVDIEAALSSRLVRSAGLAAAQQPAHAHARQMPAAKLVF